MAKIIDKEILKNLEELTRIRIEEGREEKILLDLEKILGYFEKLKELDAESVESTRPPPAVKNVFREDKIDKQCGSGKDFTTRKFPKEKNNFLEIPPVFE